MWPSAFNLLPALCVVLSVFVQTRVGFYSSVAAGDTVVVVVVDCVAVVDR